MGVVFSLQSGAACTLRGNLAEDAQQVAAPELADALFTVASPEHGISDHRQIADVAHAACERGASVEVGAEADVIFSDDLDGAIDDSDPVIDGHCDGVGHGGSGHRELRGDEGIDLVEAFAFDAVRDAGGVEKCLAALRGEPLVFAQVVELAADLEAEDAAFIDELFHQVVGHVARDVVDVAKTVVRGDDGVVAEVEDLRDGVVAGVRDVDDHVEAVHLADQLAAVCGEAFGARGGAAGVGVVLVPVVCGELGRAQAHAVEVAEDTEVAVEVVAALDVEDGCDLSLGVNAIDVSGVEGWLDEGAVFLKLAKGMVHAAKSLARLEAARIVLLWDVDGEEEGVFATFAGAGKVPLAVVVQVAHAAAVVELAVERVDVRVEDEGPLMKLACARGDAGRGQIGGSLREGMLPAKRGNGARAEEPAAGQQRCFSCGLKIYTRVVRARRFREQDIWPI